MEKKYYLQDKRSTCGNSVSWWAVNDCGYTCDIRCARVWTKEELVEQNFWEENDYNKKYRPWEKSLVDRLTQHHVDLQDLGYKNNAGDWDIVPHTIRQWRPDLVFQAEQLQFTSTPTRSIGKSRE